MTDKSSARAVAYIRVSTDEQDLGSAAQESAVKRWSKLNAIPIQHVFIDHGVSGALPFADRPAGSALLEHVTIHKPDFVVAAKRDRFARDILVITMLERFLNDLGCKLITVDYADTVETPEQRLLLNILDVFAQHERTVIKYRTKAALAELKKQGVRLGRPPRLMGEREILARNRAFELRKEALSIRQIVNRINEEFSSDVVSYSTVQRWLKKCQPVPQTNT